MNTDKLIVPGLFDRNGVQVSNNDILRIYSSKSETDFKYGCIGYGQYVDDISLESHIGFYVRINSVTLSVGQLLQHNNEFKICGNRLNYRYSGGCK